MRAKPLTPEAVDYAWRELLARVGVDRNYLPLQFAYGESLAPSPVIVVKPSDPASGEALLTAEPGCLRWIPARDTVPSGARLPFDKDVPVLFWAQSAESTRPFAERTDQGNIIFHADLIASTFFMLSRWEEIAVPTRDEHNRFPATASVAYRQGFLDRPVVDEYACILREWLKVLFPRWSEPRPSFSIKLSHDIDRIRSFVNLGWAARQFAGDILKRHSLRRSLQTLSQAIQQTWQPERTARFHGISALAESSREFGLDSVFNFMACDPGLLDNDYRIESALVTRCVHNLRQAGFEIGFHPSYRTFQNPGQLAAEKARLDAVLGESHYGGRQHYLRFQVPGTWRHWAQAGLAYDSTLGYSDGEGFRCGTCHGFRPFDVEQNRELDLWEHPLIVMDATLRDYRGLTPEQSEARILELANRCKQVNGTFTLLWHNSSLSGDWTLWGTMYRQVVQKLAEML